MSPPPRRYRVPSLPLPYDQVGPSNPTPRQQQLDPTKLESDRNQADSGGELTPRTKERQWVRARFLWGVMPRTG